MKLTGRVTSIKTQKTATVLVESTKTHPLYKKSFVMSKKYLVDDQIGVKLGDIVEMEKVRPISKNKHWRITKVVGRSIEAMVDEELKEGVAEAIEEVMPEDKGEEESGKGEELTEQTVKEKSVEKTDRKEKSAKKKGK